MPIKVDIKENTFNSGQNFDGGGSVILEHDAYIFANGANGIATTGGPWTFNIDGAIQSDLDGLALFNTGIGAPIKNSTVNVGIEGVLYGSSVGKAGIASSLAIDVNNSGAIQGGSYGIDLELTAPSATKTMTITNHAGGAIGGVTAGIYDLDTAHTLILKNQGDITTVKFSGPINVSNSGTIGNLFQINAAVTYADAIMNSGYITSVTTGAGNDVVHNSGKIAFGANLGDGSNTLINSGTIGDVATFGIGNDILVNTGTINNTVDMGDGGNIFTNKGTLDLDALAGDGNDTFTNRSLIAGKVDLHDGHNNLVNSGTIDGTVTFGSGIDILKNAGHIADDVNLGDGKNIVANVGTVSGTLTAGTGDDKVVNGGDIYAVNLGDGNNTLTNIGQIFVGGITAADDNDTVTNHKLIAGGINLGNGHNVVVNSATIGGTIMSGDGDDAVTNTGRIAGDINLGNGNNVVINHGTIDGGPITGNGDDTVINTGFIKLSVALGGGNDTFIGSKFVDSVYDEAGDDVYKLGGGDDSVIYGASGKDFFDGGTGTDTLNASFLGVSIAVNQGTKAVTLNGQTLAALSIQSGASTGTIKTFEVITGGDANDILAGGAANEKIVGYNGDDTIYGGGGADHLTGAAGNDTFVYLGLTDSGNTKATRDTIQDFEGAGVAGGDVIDLSAIDADTKLFGDQQFHLIGPDTPFTNVPGELRWIHTPTDTIIQGDVNGDGKADFSIDLVGTKNFVDGDFVK